MITLGLAEWRPARPRKFKPTGYHVEVYWLWGSGRHHPDFNETYRFSVTDLTEIDDWVKNIVIPRITKGHAFDCGRRGYPLNPRITGLKIEQISAAQYLPAERYEKAMHEAIEKRREECRE